ncbi:MAG TPA: hypothetical protein VFA92_12675 [Candidatus Binatia bacterium]|nr:hypothetical protein [Candidatus Binatia bacterium]
MAFVDTGPGEAAFGDDLDACASCGQGAPRPGWLTRRLADLGWAAHVEPLGQTFFVGWAHRR